MTSHHYHVIHKVSAPHHLFVRLTTTLLFTRFHLTTTLLFTRFHLTTTLLFTRFHLTTTLLFTRLHLPSTLLFTKFYNTPPCYSQGFISPPPCYSQGFISRVGNSLIGFPRKSLVFCKKMSDFLIRSFLVSNLSNSLTLLTKKEGMSELLIF